MQEAIPFNIFENSALIGVPEMKACPEGQFDNKRVLVYLMPYQSIGEQRPQVEKIFAACKVAPEELLVVDQPLDWSVVQRQESIKEVFLFGIAPRDIGILYTLFPYRFLSIGDKKVVLADPLDLIMGQAQLKNDFWHNCLKPYYLGT